MESLKYNILKRNEHRYKQNPPPTYEEMVAKGFIDGNGNVVQQTYASSYPVLQKLTVSTDDVLRWRL